MELGTTINRTLSIERAQYLNSRFDRLNRSVSVMLAYAKTRPFLDSNKLRCIDKALEVMEIQDSIIKELYPNG